MVRSMFITVVSLAVLAPISALALTCPSTPVTLSFDFKGGDFSARIPIYDQAHTGWCYAYTASQLIDYHRFSKAVRERYTISHPALRTPISPNVLTSPFYLALNASMNEPALFSLFNQGSALDGDFVGKTMKLARTTRICSMDSVTRAINPDRLLSSDEDRNTNSSANYLRFLESTYVHFYKLYSSLSSPVSVSMEQSLFNTARKTASKEVAKNETTPIRATLQNAMIQLAKTSGNPMVLHRFISRLACSVENQEAINSLPAVRNVWTIAMLDSTAKAKGRTLLDSLLCHPTRPRPIAISYCAEFLQKDKSFRFRETPWKVNTCGLHASVISGRRIEKGVLQYRIRNSWGNSCYGYKWACEKGQLWIDADALLDNTIGFTYLDV